MQERIVTGTRLHLENGTRLYTRLGGHLVRCEICAHRCTIPDGKKGLCKVRRCQDGTIELMNYGRLVSLEPFKPIEKGPLYHFWPGSRMVALGATGCNFKCDFCCSWPMSQVGSDDVIEEENAPEDIVNCAKGAGCRSIMYTHTEPTVSFEYVRDIAICAHKQGLFNVFVTNGYMTPLALDVMAPHIDAMNITLKSFSDKFYREVCGASLEPVLETITMAKEKDIHVEMAYLLIPGHTDGKEVEKMVRFVAEVDPEMPTFFLRFFPSYKMDGVPMTSEGALDKARRTGLDAGLKYVYIGNTYTSPGKHTYCPGCGGMVIERQGDRVFQYRIADGNMCPQCGERIPIIGEYVPPKPPYY